MATLTRRSTVQQTEQSVRQTLIKFFTVVGGGAAIVWALAISLGMIAGAEIALYIVLISGGVMLVAGGAIVLLEWRIWFRRIQRSRVVNLIRAL